MIYTDKTAISDAMGCVYSWSQAGAPEEVAVDRGSAYISDEAYHILASLGITNLGVPAGKPWLKPFIERVFRTLHSLFLQRFSGRNFSNVVERGENEPEARATLTLDEFLMWLVRWTVDGYHNRRHDGLGMTPLQAWNLATVDKPVRQLTSKEMRLAFGLRLTRKLGRGGVTIKRVDYFADVLYQTWIDDGEVSVEVCWWHGDIGCIEVRVGNGDWITAPAKDERWIGKTDVDLNQWLRPVGTDPDAEEARLWQIYEQDQRSLALKASRGLLAVPRTAAGLELTEAHFARHVDTAERRHLAGPYRSLFDDVVDAEASVAPLGEQVASAPRTATLRDEDLLE